TVDEGPLPVVRLEPGMTQPPRPEVEFPMPFADEAAIAGFDRDPIARILDPKRPRLNIFDGLENLAEESENKEIMPPAPPLADYHHNQCPYHGGCPSYYRR